MYVVYGWVSRGGTLSIYTHIQLYKYNVYNYTYWILQAERRGCVKIWINQALSKDIYDKAYWLNKLARICHICVGRVGTLNCWYLVYIQLIPYYIIRANIEDTNRQRAIETERGNGSSMINGTKLRVTKVYLPFYWDSIRKKKYWW